MNFRCLLRPAELDKSATPCFLRGHTRLEIFLNGQVEMNRHLRVEIVVEFFSTKEGGEAME